MLSAIGAGLELATEVFKLINTEEARKYLDRAVKLQLEINEEEAKGYNSDDAKLEAWYKEFKVIKDAAIESFKLLAPKQAS